MSQIYGPNGVPVVDLQLERVEIGGLPLDFQPNPNLGVTFSGAAFGLVPIQIQENPLSPPQPAFVIGRPENLMNLLAAFTNINNALIREFIAIRARLAELEGAAAERTTTRLQAADADAGEAVGEAG